MGDYRRIPASPQLTHATYLCDSKTLELNKAKLFLSLAESGKRWFAAGGHGHTRGHGLAILGRRTVRHPLATHVRARANACHWFSSTSPVVEKRVNDDDKRYTAGMPTFGRASGLQRPKYSIATHLLDPGMDWALYKTE